MQKHSRKNQSGIAHVIAIVAMVVLVGAVGYVGYQALTKNKSAEDVVADKIAQIAAGKECMDEYNDEDLCKFLNSWNMNAEYKIVSTSTSEGQTNSSTMMIKGESSYMKTDGEYGMEVITIGDTTYTKAGDTWWKQTAEKTDEPESAPSEDDFEFEEPTEDSTEENTTTYTLIGKEACGDQNCFKYQVIDSSDSGTTEYIWFDDKEYLIRKTVTESSEYKSESTFSYSGISIEVPSPVKDLAPNQYIMPGQSEPQTMPDVPQTPTEAEIQEMMQQYSE